MDLIRIAIDRPIAVIAAVMMAVMFGLVALSRIPIQLAPDVRKPIIVVETNWAGAAPAEIEREIVNPQEEQLKGLEGLETMVSTSETGQAEVTLEFAIGTNMDRALLLVSNRLDRVSGYPERSLRADALDLGLRRQPDRVDDHHPRRGQRPPIQEYGDFVDDVVKETIERVEGVSAVNYFGGVERELQVVIDPDGWRSSA
jgi:HAE1 family hydrophobic/amphiphilic exporter-1